jgi:anti-sigma B factor antagonist
VAALPNFRIETFHIGTGTTIKLVGELDSAACAEFLATFEQATAAPDASEVVVDLVDVSFIDSAGMRAIIAIERRVTERGLALTISPPPDEVTELLQVTGIAERVTLAPRADEAPPTAPFVERIALDLPRDPQAPGRARAELRSALPGRISDADRATLTLLTSELVTNAVIHPAPGVEGVVALRITAYADRIRVEVGDDGSGFDLQELPPRPREAGGHGLIVVAGLASRWGTSRRSSPEDDGFCVWFELDVNYQPQAAGDTAEGIERPVAAAEG